MDFARAKHGREKRSRGEDLRRAAVLLLVATCGGALLGALSTVHYAHAWWIVQRGAVVGAMVGLLISPATLLMLWDRRLKAAVPLLYGSSAVVAVFCSWFDDVLISLGGTAWFFFGMQLVTRWFTPDTAVPAHLCPVCEYDLSGLNHDRCPECGTACERRLKK